MKNIKSNDSWFKIQSFIGEDKRILDVGCSSGNLGKSLKEVKSAYVVGIDIDKQDVESASKVLNEAYKVDLEKDSLDFLGKFDVIIMADVIEHLVAPVAVLKKLRSLLNKEGIFVFSVPNMANATIRLELLKGSFEYHDYGLLDRTHLHFYDRNEIERVLAEAGFNVVDMDCPIRVIPDDILSKELEAVGIQLTDKLRKHLSSPDAATFQFIGYAKPGTGKSSVKLKTTTPLDVITKEIDSIREDFTSQLNEKDERLSSLQAQYDEVNNRLNEIHHSKGWKVLNNVYGIKKHLRKK